MRRGRQPLYPRLLLQVAMVVTGEEEGGRKIEEKAVERDELKEEEAKDKDRGKVGR